MMQRTSVFQGAKFRLETVNVQGADGKTHRYEVVAHAGAALVLPRLNDGRVILIRNERPAVDAELLELPAGTIDGQESPAECATRELAEETGYRAGRIQPLLWFYSTPGICTERMHAFVATELVAGETEHEPTERIRVMPMEYEDALAAIGEGRIVDAKTIVALLFYERFVRRQGNG